VRVSALRLLQAVAAPRTGSIAPARPRHSAPACAARVAPAPPSWARPPASAAASWPASPFLSLALWWCQGVTLLPAPSRRHDKLRRKTRTRAPRCPQTRAAALPATEFAQHARPPQPQLRGQPGAHLLRLQALEQAGQQRGQRRGLLRPARQLRGRRLGGPQAGQPRSAGRPVQALPQLLPGRRARSSGWARLSKRARLCGSRDGTRRACARQRATHEPRRGSRTRRAARAARSTVMHIALTCLSLGTAHPPQRSPWEGCAAAACPAPGELPRPTAARARRAPRPRPRLQGRRANGRRVAGQRLQQQADLVLERQAAPLLLQHRVGLRARGRRLRLRQRSQACWHALAC
jgi:hypothetical protein